MLSKKGTREGKPEVDGPGRTVDVAYVPLNSVCQKGKSPGILRSLPANPNDPGGHQSPGLLKGAAEGIWAQLGAGRS